MEKSGDVNSPVPPSADNCLSTKIRKEIFFFFFRKMIKRTNKRQEIKIYVNIVVPRATVNEPHCIYRRKHKS